MVSIKLAQEVSELEGILALQRRNLKRCLSEAEAEVYDRQLRVWGVEGQQR